MGSNPVSLGGTGLFLASVTAQSDTGSNILGSPVGIILHALQMSKRAFPSAKLLRGRRAEPRYASESRYFSATTLLAATKNAINAQRPISR